MNRLAIASALLLAASSALAQDYPGDDEYSWQQPAEAPPPPQQGPTLNDFQNDSELAANGQWVDTPEYGTVWQPTAVDSDWQPYMFGHWAWTEAGWAWMSDEPFGWAVYHYGRWAWSPDLGWLWVPGRVWGPAWVAWRSYDGYAGWCALGPRGLPAAQPQRWVWVDHAHFLEPVQQHHVVPHTVEGMPPPSVGPHAGPAVAVVQRASGRPVQPLAVRDTPSPHAAQAGGGSVYFYRPRTAPVTPQARPPQQRPYFGGVPGPAYGGAPRPQAQPAQTQPQQPQPKAKSSSEQPRAKEKP